MGVAEWFSGFDRSLVLTSEKRTSIAYRTARITRALNSVFRGLNSDDSNRFYVGSMGRNTAIPTVSDVDLLYVMPYQIFQTYDSYSGNKQSALLSAVRNAIAITYPTSRISGDGQVVVISFDDGITYEVLPAFLNMEDGYTFADTNSGGSWKSCKPKHEINAFQSRDLACNRNLVSLCRMVRAWKDTNNVSISGMLIDTMCFNFIENWAYKDKSYFYYDFLTRDFFRFLAAQSVTQTFWKAPGSGSFVSGGGFQYKARRAELKAIEICAHIAANQEWSAKQKLREIYGSKFTA